MVTVLVDGSNDRYSLILKKFKFKGAHVYNCQQSSFEFANDEIKLYVLRVIFSFLAVLTMTTYEDMEVGGQGGHKRSLVYFLLQIPLSSRVSLLKFCSSSTMATWMILNLIQ